MGAVLRDFVSHVRLADLLDVTLVSIVLYGLITWMRRTASKRIMAVVGLFVIVYVLARVFEMYLTKMMIEALLAVAFITGIIVFQPDIRRGVDQMGGWLLSRRTNKPRDTSPLLDMLTETASRLAEDNVGALMAVKGREAWDRHIEGGIELNGRPSRPLLLSIFDPNSPGHDGAALIEGETLTRFGAHLPLSTNEDATGSHGTRHAAAVGLTEQCDALVIVVSEERGCISVAQHGRLNEIESPGELKGALEKFWRTHVHKPRGRRERTFAWWRRANLQTGVVSVVLASAFWFLLAYRSEIVYRTFPVPIEFRNPQPDQLVENALPEGVRVTLAGTEQAFRLLNPASLQISIDLAKLGDGQAEVPISQDNIRLPAGIKLHQVEPREVPVRSQRLHEAQAIVEVATTGELPEGKVLLALTPEPRTLTLLVPGRPNKDPLRVLTEPIDLSAMTTTTKTHAKLALPPGARLRGEGSGASAGDETAEIVVTIEVE